MFENSISLYHSASPPKVESQKQALYLRAGSNFEKEPLDIAR